MLPNLSNAEVFGPNIATAVNLSAASSTARCCVTALPGAYTGTLTGVLTASANGAIAAQNGVTVAAGDLVLLLEGATHVAANADAGLYVVTAPGTASLPYILTRHAGWGHGATIQVGASIAIGGEDTLFGGSCFTAFCAKGTVIDTGDPAFYPDKVTQIVTLAAGTHAALTNVPIRPTSIGPAAGGAVVVSYAAAGTPEAGTTNFVTAAFTAGYLGTASTGAINAVATIGGATQSTDVSKVFVHVFN